MLAIVPWQHIATTVRHLHGGLCDHAFGLIGLSLWCARGWSFRARNRAFLSRSQIRNPALKRREVRHVSDVPELLGGVPASAQSLHCVFLGEGGDQVDSHAEIISVGEPHDMLSGMVTNTSLGQNAFAVSGKKPTALVLGAGASNGYGFPVGSALRQAILNLRDSDDASLAMSHGKGAIRNFVDAFRDSQITSIDSFLGRRQDFVEIGKSAIAYILLNCEEQAKLTDESHGDHWYQYLVNELVEDSWETFDPSWLSVVTFNYDRSLLKSLVLTVGRIYNKTEAESLERLRRVRMVHVYGSLGDPFAEIPFGPTMDEEYASMHVDRAAKKLVIIPEGRDDSPTIQEAQGIISTAERICFLGFGFDAVNIRRLGAPNLFRRHYENPGGVVGTCLGLTLAEQHRALRRMFGNDINPGTVSRGFQEGNCIDLLRETLILD